jgi:hypothetical protein
VVPQIAGERVVIPAEFPEWFAWPRYAWRGSMKRREEGIIRREAQILREGELVIGRRFELRRLAEQWAEEERKALERS